MVEFRQATASDVVLLESLEARCFLRAWPKGYVAHELSLPQSEFWLAFVEGNVCGYLHVWVVAGEGSLLSMAVLPEARRQGLGRALMGQLRHRVQQHGCEELHLEVRESNLGAQSLYRSTGFAVTGRRKGYYADSGEDALLMSCALDSACREE